MAENQYVSKVVLSDGRTLIDLTGDTISPDKLAKDITAHDKSGAPITGTNTFDVDSGDATAQVAEILFGKTAYARGTKLTGTMPNRGAVSGEISEKDGSVSIQQGYHDGSGSVVLANTEKAKLIPGNIKEGVQLFGVTGTLAPASGVTAQAKSATPSFTSQIISPDDGYDYLSQVTVAAISVVETDNSAGGKTVTVGG